MLSRARNLNQIPGPGLAFFDASAAASAKSLSFVLPPALGAAVLAAACCSGMAGKSPMGLPGRITVTPGGKVAVTPSGIVTDVNDEHSRIGS